MVRDDSNGRIYLLDTVFMKHMTSAEAGALTAIGFTYTSHAPAVLQALASAHGVPAASIPANNGTYSLANAVPVTVQGASEQFITNTMGQVNANNNALANTTNALNVQYRDNVKAHVTAEATRVIDAV